MQIDLRVVELLSSKLCHDLISPVSAINNGVELIEDIGGSVVDEAMKLIGDSAVLGAKRLRMFRLAYGRAGSEECLGVKDVKPIVDAYFTGGKIVLEWPEDIMREELAVTHGSMKVMINLMIFAEEILAYGGAISVKAAEQENGGGAVKIEVAGRAAQLNDTLKAALEGSTAVEELSPRTVQAYMTGRFAEHFNFKIQYVEPAPDTLDFILPLSRHEYDENPPI